MIIKEFRIVIPMTVEEYQIGQLYTIQKKSRIESVGAGSGVEIIENKPFEESNEKGQYTMKVYHVDERLPSSLKTVTKLLFPKSALLFEEESWNSYPYTRTKYRHKLFKSFNIDIESKYLADCGESENTFNLKKSELSMRQVDFIDIVNDSVNPNEYKVDEDPSLFESKLNKNRGPMLPNWLTTLRASVSANKDNKKVAYMCCYKLCRIECAFWGCQSRVEKSIADSVLRNMLLITHRQAWTWQDEYYNLTMDDVRKLEEETRRYLMKKMNDDHEGETTLIESKSQSIDSNSNLEIERLEIDTSNTSTTLMKKMDSDNSMKSCQSINEEMNDYKSNHLNKCQHELEFNLNMLGDNSEDVTIDQSNNLDNTDEFYDAISQASFNLSTVSNGDQPKLNSLIHKKKNKLINLRSLSMNSEISNEFLTSSNLHSSSDLYRSTKSIENYEQEYEKTNNVFNTQESYNSSRSFTLETNRNGITSLVRKSSDNKKLKIQQTKPTTIDTLILVVHGGNVTCTDTSKKSDFTNFKSTMESVIKQHYNELSDNIAYRLVACEPKCKEALINLSNCNPVACKEAEVAETCAGVFGQNENLPFSTIPLLITANQTQYRESVAKFTKDCNKVYNDFITNTCVGFQGKVVLIGDSIGSLLVYDALTNITLTNQNDSLSSTSSVSNLIKPSSASPSPILTRKNEPTNSLDHNHNPFFHLTSSTYSNEADTSSSNHNSASESFSSFFTPEKTVVESEKANNDERLDFDVNHFFVFGSPLGLILTHRKLSQKKIQVPACTQMYNMFHLTDPGAYRVEPLLCKQFSYIQPCMVPRYTKFPLGDGYNLSLDHFIVKHGNLFDLNNNFNKSSTNRNINKQVESFLTPNFDQLKSLHRIIQTKKDWWGDNRLDYVLYAPEKIANLPKNSLPYLFHSCYWESTDVSAFILRMLTKQDNYQLNSESDCGVNIAREKPTLEIEKWQRKFNRVKLRNLSPNHRSNDVIVNEDKEQILSAKFSYGPLDFVLSGEKIDIYILNENVGNSSPVNKSVTNEWDFLDTTVTDNHGKVIYEIPKSKHLSLGIYQIKMVVKCDHSYVEFYMAVLPANTQAVVFSIDGSFAANISFTGTDPKVRAGAVDVVRYWTDLGYLIIYVTARPDMQHYKVTNWLAQHNFPLGMVFFSNGLRHDPIKQKTETLRNLVINNKLNLSAAYGSPKDIPMYSSLGVTSNRIFIIAKTKSKYLNSASVLKDGYASHLATLKSPNNTDLRQASGNACLILKRVNLSTFSIKQNPIFCNTNENNLNSPSLSPQQYSNETTSVLSINPSSSSGSKQLFNAFSANFNSLIDNQQNIKSKIKSHININK